MSSPHEQAEFGRMVIEEFDFLMKKMNRSTEKDRRGGNEKPQRASDSAKSR